MDRRELREAQLLKSSTDWMMQGSTDCLSTGCRNRTLFSRQRRHGPGIKQQLMTLMSAHLQGW
jgi:hypothetical protein